LGDNGGIEKNGGVIALSDFTSGSQSGEKASQGPDGNQLPFWGWNCGSKKIACEPREGGKTNPTRKSKDKGEKKKKQGSKEPAGTGRKADFQKGANTQGKSKLKKKHPYNKPKEKKDDGGVNSGDN